MYVLILLTSRLSEALFYEFVIFPLFILLSLFQALVFSDSKQIVHGTLSSSFARENISNTGIQYGEKEKLRVTLE